MRVLGISALLSRQRGCRRRRWRRRGRRPGGALHPQEARCALSRARHRLLPGARRLPSSPTSMRWCSTRSRSSSSSGCSRPISALPRAASNPSAWRCRYGCARSCSRSSMLTKELQKFAPDFDPREAAAVLRASPQSHAASAFYPSPFEEAAVLTMDGVGEWSTTSLALGQGKLAQGAARRSTFPTRSACSTRPSPITWASRSTPASTRSWGSRLTASPDTRRRSSTPSST